MIGYISNLIYKRDGAIRGAKVFVAEIKRVTTFQQTLPHWKMLAESITAKPLLTSDLDKKLLHIMEKLKHKFGTGWLIRHASTEGGM